MTADTHLTPADHSPTQTLRSEHSAWHFLFENCRDAIVLINLHGGVVDANQAFIDMLGHTRENIYEMNVWDWDVDLDRQTILGLLANIDVKGALFETRHWHHDGSIINVEISSNATFYKNEWILMCICRDITERKRHQKELLYFAITDPLTGLTNRREFSKQLIKALKKTKQHGHNFALIFLDLDHFKEINDTFGHEVGDRVLMNTARVIKASLPKSAHAARWGGEEFTLLIPDINGIEAHQLAENIRSHLEMSQKDKLPTVTASFGITISNNNDDSRKLLNRADKAMYEAKEKGRNRVVTLA